MENNNLPYVSIVMTSYNRETYIRQAIDSILSQICDFQFEIIIGDDCSTDNTRELLLAYKDKYPHIFVLNFHDMNQGFGVNWATTCKLARGKYIAFLDDDDYWCDTSHLKVLVDYLDSHTQCGLVYTNRYVLDVATNTQKLANAILPNNKSMLEHFLHKGFPILFSATMLRKSVFNNYVNLDAFIKFQFPIQDYPTAILMAKHCDFHYIDKPTVVYRYYPGSMSKPKEYETVLKKYKREKIMYCYLCEQLNINFDEVNYDHYIYGILLQVAYQKGDYKSAKKFAKYVDKRNKKRLFSFTWLTFHIFRLLKKAYHKILVNNYNKATNDNK